MDAKNGKITYSTFFSKICKYRYWFATGAKGTIILSLILSYAKYRLHAT